jgi:hypothetical protein
MTPLATIHLSSRAGRLTALQAVRDAPDEAVVIVKPPRRTLHQNDKLHALVTDVANQVAWHGQKLSVEAWKDIFTAALRSSRHQIETVPGIDGGFVMLGMHTSGMSRAECSDLIELIYAFGAGHDVRWTEPKLQGGRDVED